MEGLTVSKSPVRSTLARTTRARGRARVQREDGPKRQVRASGRRATPREGAAIDDLYLSEMAESSVLTAPQELEIGECISGAERALIGALYACPAGARAFTMLSEELATGKVAARELLLNPDQADLDLEATTRDVTSALEAAHEGSAHERELAADILARVRIDDGIVGRLVEAVRSAVRSDHVDKRDVRALDAIGRAEHAIDKAKERLVIGNLRLVVLFARKYLGRGVALLDLVQEGNLGLIRAADKFDHRRGFRFSTYAAWWIKQSLQRALLDRTVRLPVHVADDRRRVSKLRAAFVAQHEREPTVDELSTLSTLGKDRIENILSLPSQPSSLDVPVGEDGDARLVDLVPSLAPTPDQTAALNALGDQMTELLGRLDEREQQILRLRFGIEQAREHTLEEVGKLLHLTRERIRQIEQAALGKLRTLANAQQMGSYLEE